MCAQDVKIISPTRGRFPMINSVCRNRSISFRSQIVSDSTLYPGIFIMLNKCCAFKEGDHSFNKNRARLYDFPSIHLKNSTRILFKA